MVWGAIIADCFRVLVWVGGNGHYEKYCEILAERLFDDFDVDQMLL